ncbi:MAG: protein translocase subunit SecD [Clostridia bacterium]|nr:protein translocase subunit SecD [Clostridia bacterium]
MNYSRAASVSRFVLLFLAIVLICSVTVCGVYFNEDTQLKGIFEDGTIRLGLDLAGGSVITYQAITDDTGDALENGMESIQTIMRDRLDNQGLTEALCYIAGDDMITIEIPDVDDPNEAIANFMQTAKLTFKDSDGKVILEGSDVANAEAGYYQTESGTTEYCVNLELTAAGESKFAEATKKAAANKTNIGIYMDDVLISNPSVSSEYASTGITGGKAMISGSFTSIAEADYLAGNINAGALSYELKVVEQRTVGATLGANSLSTSLIAGAIGLALVIVFMCIYYKVPGVMASISLAAYIGIFGLVLIFTQANLTLAGIAGIVLSIGMAVDANVVIFERMKEELALGKSVKAAIKAGYSRAFAAILDSNVTTIIACAVLYFLGSGTIKGFATTLFIGVVISLITALLITRGLLYCCVGMGITDPAKYKAFGSSKKEGKFHFIKNKKVTLSVIAVVVVLAIASFSILGFNIDIDFSGGTEIVLDLGTEVTDDVCEDIESLIKGHEKLGHDYFSSAAKSTANSNTVIIRTGTAPLTLEQQEALEAALVENYENADLKNIQVTTIQPTIGSDLTKKAILAVAIAVVLMLIYIWIRFELNSGIAAVCCLTHDLLVMLVLYSVLGIAVNTNIIAALLTILGYSINATIVVFDRIRENKKKADGVEFGETVNFSIHETLGRSINTTITTLLTIGMIYIFGVDSIKNFALPLIIGIVAGLFSSVFMSGMLWNALNKVIKPRSKKDKAAKKA